MRKTKNLTFCSIMVALSVVLLFICSFLESLNLTAVLLSSICVFVVDEELHMKRALGVYLATGILAFLLLPSILRIPIHICGNTALPAPCAARLFAWVSMDLTQKRKPSRFLSCCATICRNELDNTSSM